MKVRMATGFIFLCFPNGNKYINVFGTILFHDWELIILFNKVAGRVVVVGGSWVEKLKTKQFFGFKGFIQNFFKKQIRTKNG